MAIYRVWKNDPNRSRLSAYKYHLKKGDLLSQTEYDNLRRGRKQRKPCTLSDAQILKKWKGWLLAAAIIFVVVMRLMN